MTRNEAITHVINELAKLGIKSDGRSATFKNVTAFNPAAKKEITGDAVVMFSYGRTITVSGTASRGNVAAAQLKYLEEIVINDFVPKQKGFGVFGAADEESF